MPIKFFAVPAIEPGEAEAELNRFLRGHRVVTAPRELAMVDGRPVWCVAVEYVESPVQQRPSDDNARRNKIDYREVLSGEDFVRFAKLRELRKAMSDEEGVPVYAIFTNEQLAAIAQKQPKTSAELQSVDGVGEGKNKRYGERVLGLLQALNGPSAPTAAI